MRSRRELRVGKSRRCQERRETGTFDLVVVVTLSLYLSDVNDFVQLREEPVYGIVDLAKLPVGDADPG